MFSHRQLYACVHHNYNYILHILCAQAQAMSLYIHIYFLVYMRVIAVYIIYTQARGVSGSSGLHELAGLA